MNRKLNSDLTSYNDLVKATYFKLLNRTKNLLSTLDNTDLRGTLSKHQATKKLHIFTVVHEFVTPVVYLALQCDGGQRLSIHFGFEQVGIEDDYTIVTGPFMRMLYTLTSKEHTPINIEVCVSTDYVFTHCIDLFTSIASVKSHKFKLLEYKPATARRKQMRAVA
jgi:hypothetical protein